MNVDVLTSDLPNRYKPHYGIRHIDGTRMVFGFDVFHQIASHGLDLEVLLDTFNENGIQLDWYNFFRSALETGWTYKTIVSKVKYPIEYVYGVDYWNEVHYRLKLLILSKYEKKIIYSIIVNCTKYQKIGEAVVEKSDFPKIKFIKLKKHPNNMCVYCIPKGFGVFKDSVLMINGQILIDASKFVLLRTDDYIIFDPAYMENSDEIVLIPAEIIE